MSVSLFCLQAEQDRPLPVGALSLLCHKLSALFSPILSSSPLAFTYTSRVVPEHPVCPLESSVAYSAGSRKTFSLSFRLWGSGFSEASEREERVPKGSRRPEVIGLVKAVTLF